MHICIVCSYLKRFNENLLCGFREVAMTNCCSSILKQISSKGRNSKKKNWIVISCRYAHLHSMILLSKKVSWNSVVCFERTFDEKKQDWRTDGQMDGRTDIRTDRRMGQKHYTLRNFVAWGIIEGEWIIRDPLYTPSKVSFKISFGVGFHY